MLIPRIQFYRIIILCLSCKAVQSLVHSSYVGCYEDSVSDRKLTGYNITLPKMTTQICNYICFQKGFEYAATQNKIECYCGDYNDRHPPQTIDDSYCEDKTLVGDVRNAGETERLTLKVYRTGIEEAKWLESKYIGCISDGDNVLLPRHKLEFTKTNSPARCVAACASMGFKHAALSQSTLCYCGEAVEIEKTSGCDSPCPKISDVTCGGYSRLSLYKTDANPGITPILVIEMGCFKNRPKGLLKDYKETSNEMMPFRCVAFCYRRGAIYAGLHNGNECQCGLQQPNPPPEKVPDEFCSNKCYGNSSETCGSTQYVKGISTSVLGRHPLFGKSLGCFRDTMDTPREVTTQSEDNNPVKCIADCISKRYAFAAVKKSECRCGNSKLKYVQKNILGDSSCNELCPDNSLTCGGESAVSVYRTGLDFKAQESCSKSLTEVGPDFGGDQVCSGKLIFEDNFDSLDYNKWQRTVRISGEDYEFVTYSYEKANSFVKDGKLHIKPTLMNDEAFIRNGELSLVGCTGTGEECKRKAVSFRILPPVKSAQLTTKNVFAFKYGVINIRARLPRGDWIYPQLWLKPLANAYGPDYWSGKLVVTTSVGNGNLTSASGEDIGLSRVQAGVLMGESPNTFRSKMVSFRSSRWSEDFHNYTVIWSPESIIMYVDDKRYDVKTVVEMNEKRHLATDAGFSEKDSYVWDTGTKAAPFDQKFYLTVGLGVGGYTNFPDSTTSSGKSKPWQNYQVKGMLNFWQAKQDWFPTWSDDSQLIIDYISVHAL